VLTINYKLLLLVPHPKKGKAPVHRYKYKLIILLPSPEPNSVITQKTTILLLITVLDLSGTINVLLKFDEIKMLSNLMYSPQQV
jgi:hypothetical protein